MKKVLFILLLFSAFTFSAYAKGKKVEKKRVEKIKILKFPVVFSLPCGITVYADYQCPGCTLQQMLQDIGQAGLQLQQQLCGYPAP